MNVVKVYIIMTLLKMCCVHAGEFPATCAVKGSAMPSPYQTETTRECFKSSGHPLGPDAEAATSGALDAFVEALQGWWAKFIGVSDEHQEVDQQSCLDNVTTLADKQPDLSGDDWEDFEWKIWRPSAHELSIDISILIEIQSDEPEVDLAPPTPQLKVAEDENFMCLSSDAPTEDALGNVTNDEIDDVTSDVYLPIIVWQTISAWMEGIPTHIVIKYMASAHKQIDARPPYATTMPMTSFEGQQQQQQQQQQRPQDATPDIEFISFGILGDSLESAIRPGDVFLEKPSNPAWVIHTVSVFFMCVIVCLLSPLWFTGEEQKKEARLAKALKRRRPRGNTHGRSGRRFAAYMNAKGRE